MTENVTQETFDTIEQESNLGFGGLGFELEHSTAILNKTKAIVEDFLNAKVRIENGDTGGKEYLIKYEQNYGESQGEYVVQLPFGSVDSKTSFERAMGELLYGTDRGRIAQVSNEACDNVSYDYKNQAEEMFKAGYETLNQIRCQDALGKQYKGSGERFVTANESDAVKHQEEIKNPIEALRARKAGVDLSTSGFDNKKVDEFIELSKGLSRKGVAKLSKKFYNEIAEPWLIKQIKELEKDQPPEQEPSNDGEEEDKEDNENENEDQDSDSDDKESKEEDMDYEAGDSGDDGDDIKEGTSVGKAGWEAKENLEDLNKELGIDKDKPEGFHSGTENINTPSLEKLSELDKGEEGEGKGFNPYQSDGSFNNEDLEDYDFDAEQHLGSQDWDKVENRLFNMDSEKVGVNIDYPRDIAPHISKYDVKSYNDYPSDVYINNGLVRSIRKGFQRILTAKGEENETEGFELDINAFINSRTDGRADIFIQESDTTGFSCVIGVDLSGSMAGERLDMCQRICSLLMESVKGIPRVDVKVIGWSGSGKKAHVCECVTVDEVRYLTTSSLTPMGSSMWHCKYELEQMKGNRKVMFFLTDGYPNDNRDIGLVKEAVNQMKAKRFSVLGLGIDMESEDGDTEQFREMFGSGWINCPNVQSVEKLCRTTSQKK